MAYVAFAVLLAFSIVALLLLTSRLANRSYLIPAWLGWAGSMLVFGAFLLLPWATTGSPGTFTSNADWLADQTVYLDRLRQLPVVQDKIASLKVDTVDDIRQLLTRPETSQFLAHVERGSSLSALQLLSMARHVSLGLPFALVVGLLASLLTLLASLLALSPMSDVGAKLRVAVGVLAAISLVLLLGKLPFIDTLGATDNFAVRLIAVLGEVQVAAGGWWMAIGLLLLVCTSVFYLILGRSSTLPDQDDAGWN